MIGHSIIEVLKLLFNLHKKLLELGEEKTLVVKKGEISKLQDIINKEHSTIKRINQAEIELKKTIDLLAKSNNKKGTFHTISDCLPYLDESTQNSLKNWQKKLLDVVKLLKERNDLNQQLIYLSLQYVNMNLFLLNPKDDKGLYTNPLKKQSRTQSSLFDSKA
jgi:hypothetical protein